MWGHVRFHELPQIAATSSHGRPPPSVKVVLTSVKGSGRDFHGGNKMRFDSET